MPQLQADTQVGWAPYSDSQTSVRTSSKLRDSCHACAMSKVKCPKEKPSCSRCQSRDITCQYFLTRRPGRRRENSTTRRQSSTSNSNASSSNTDIEMSQSTDKETIQGVQPSIGSRFLPGSMTPPADLSQNNSYLCTSPTMSISTSPRPDNMFAPDNVFVPDSMDVFSVFGEMFPGLSDFGSDINDTDFATLAMDSPFGMPLLDSDNINEAQNDIESLLIPAEGINRVLASSEIPAAVDLLTTSSGPSSLASKVQAMSTWNPGMPAVIDTSSCGCFMKALDLLKMLSAAPSHTYASFNTSSPDFTETCDLTNDGSARTLLKENKQSIEAVNSMLACSLCTKDSFLLTLSSMIVLKILERYAAAARTKPQGAVAGSDTEADGVMRMPANKSIISNNIKDQIRVSSRTYSVPRDDKARGRMAAQLVLSELHRVQRLVNQLSPRLKGPKEGGGRNLFEQDFWGSHEVSADSEKVNRMAPFSAGTLDRVENDVRKCLSSLSTEIINVLRQS